MMAKEYITVMFDRFDKICEKHYGHTNERIVEIVIEANPGLEECGIIIPIGTKVILPVIETDNETPLTKGQIFLWS